MEHRIERVGLYRALLQNLVPPVFLLVALSWVILGLVYFSSVIGGQAWIDSAKNGSIPQVLELIERQGVICLQQHIRHGSSECAEDEAWPATVFRLDDDIVEVSVGGVVVPLEGVREVLSGNDLGGFTVFDGRALQLVSNAGGDGSEIVLLRDVTEDLLYRLSTAAAVEVELLGQLDEQPFATTFLGSEGNALRVDAVPPQPEMRWRDFKFEGRYQGYRSRGSEGWVIDEGASGLSAFARLYTAKSIEGLSPLSIVISVPKSVMLGYTNQMVFFSFLATGGVLFWAGWMLRRLTNQQIEPISALARRVADFRRSLTVDDSETQPALVAASSELESLEYAIELLEEKIRENSRLERQMRQHERLEAIGRLTGGIAHDFNNLLNIVVANCSFLEEDLDDPGLLESVSDIASAANSATEMTSALLSFSSGRTASIPGGRDVSKEVKAAVNLVARSIGPEVNVTLDVEPDLLATISGSQLQQVIMNLVLNARDAAVEDQVDVVVSLKSATVSPAHRPQEHPADWICLSVSDNGMGMSERVQERIFEPFYSNKEYYSNRGAGLGLSVIYGIIEGIGGCIEVESSEGEGAAFKVFLPRATDMLEEHEVFELEGLERMEILLVEDDYGVRRVVRAMLTRMGMQVLDFESGLEVRRWLESDPELAFDALVTDIRMPGMDGYQVANMCRAHFPDLPVVFMTGFDPDADRRGQYVNSVLLMKPMRREDLGYALRTLSLS